MQWNDTARSAQDGTTERAWEGYLAVTLAPPTTTEGVERNPLGVFVTDLAWSPLAGTARTVPPDAGTEAPVDTTESAPRRPPPTVRAPDLPGPSTD